MKTMSIVFSILAVCAFTQLSSANDNIQEIEIFYGEDDVIMKTIFKNPPGSKWISVRCARRSICLPPEGYKFRHFNTEISGSKCKGSIKRRVKQTKDYIKTSSHCSVEGRVFIWPAEYCKGNYKNCSSK